nr:MAG TPA: hypothetical protein [Caudoviricetes sp.]
MRLFFYTKKQTRMRGGEAWQGHQMNVRSRQRSCSCKV